jgi:DNA-binding NarL/FixJ family response regulator
MVKVSVIIPDDNILLRKFLRMTIEADPILHFSIEAGYGLDLLEQLEGIIPDIIIMEVSLPGLYGIELAERYKKLHPQVKIVILTTHLDQYFFHRAVNIGIEGYIYINEIEKINQIIKIVSEGKNYISSYFNKKNHEPVGENFHFSQTAPQQRNIMHKIG